MGAIVGGSLSYDPNVDILNIRLSTDPIEESQQITPSIILDYNVAGEIIGLEILDIAKLVCPSPIK